MIDNSGVFYGYTVGFCRPPCLFNNPNAKIVRMLQRLVKVTVSCKLPRIIH